MPMRENLNTVLDNLVLANYRKSFSTAIAYFMSWILLVRKSRRNQFGTKSGAFVAQN